MPRLLSVVFASNTTITLSWMPPISPNGIITKYHLQYKEITDSSYFILLPTNDAMTRTVTRLTPSIQYQFRVSAVTVAGHGNYSRTINHTTLSKFLE